MSLAQERFDDLFNCRTFLSGRTYWVGGTQVTDKNGSAIFNCTFRQINDISAFAESYYWLLLGAGVGFSVEQDCIKQLPNFVNQFNITHKTYNYNKSGDKYTKLNRNLFNINDLQLKDRDFKQKVYETLKENNHQSPIVITVGDSKEGWAFFLTSKC